MGIDQQGEAVAAEVRVADEFAIRNVLNRYTCGIDRLDFETVRSCYWPGATDERGQFNGTVEGFLEYAAAVMAQMIGSTHFLGNVLVQFTGAEEAHVESYCLSLDRFQDAEERVVDSFSQLRYVDLFHRRDGRWAISRRRMIIDASSSKFVESDQHALGLRSISGSRDRSDHVYTTLSEWTALGRS